MPFRPDRLVPAAAACLVAACLGFVAAPAGAQALPIPTMPKPFGQMPSPPAPDYARDDAWAALFDRLDAADFVPENDPLGDRQFVAQVDVFYIHPTTWRGTTFWNAPLDDAKTNAWTDESVIARQASVFSACCRVYAPRYRQATAAAVYARPDQNPLGAYDFAWQDVKAAFQYYMENWNQGRPFIIAGHSQGAAMIERWLGEFGADPKVRSLMVAAYPIGIGFPEGMSSRAFHGIPFCRAARDTGCIVSWNTFERGGDPGQLVGGAQKRYAERFGTTEGQDVHCTNPLTFDAARPAAPASWNLGALPARPGVGVGEAFVKGTPLPPTEAGRLGAECRGGVLFVDPPPKEGYAIVPLPGGMLHFNDFDLFFQNIRINAVARTEAWLAVRRMAR